MATALMDLASPVFLWVGNFRLKLERGTLGEREEVREEILALLHEQDHRSHREANLGEAWALARNALIYLVDEVAITENWDGAGWWEDNDLEVMLLEHPHMLRAVLFYKELDNVKKKYENARRVQAHDYDYLIDVLTVFYCCLRFGFKGELRENANKLESTSRNIMSRLPCAERTQRGQYFEQAYAHTQKTLPAYLVTMRLITLACIALGLGLTMFGVHRSLWSRLQTHLEASRSHAGRFFDPAAMPGEDLMAEAGTGHVGDNG